MKIGLSSCSKPFCEELFRDYAKAGISAMEISYDLEHTNQLDFALAKKYADKFGVELWSLHLPFMPFSVIDISRPDLADFSLEYYSKLLLKANSEAGITRFVVHPSGEPISDENRKTRLETSKKYLIKLAKIAKSVDSVILVENLPRTCLGRNSDEIVYLTECHESLKVVFDTNHLLCEKISDFISKVGGRIASTHISDYDFIDEKHWLPGEGMINWNELYADLNAAGYDGVWLYEVGFDIPKSLPSRSRKLCCEDFRNNAEEIFAGREIAVI